MNTPPTFDLFRQAAEAEGGMSISAGARVAHIRSALQSGQALYVDLSLIAEDSRAAVADEIVELVQRASAAHPHAIAKPGAGR